MGTSKTWDWGRWGPWRSPRGSLSALEWSQGCGWKGEDGGEFRCQPVEFDIRLHVTSNFLENRGTLRCLCLRRSVWQLMGDGLGGDERLSHWDLEESTTWCGHRRRRCRFDGTRIWIARQEKEAILRTARFGSWPRERWSWWWGQEKLTQRGMIC